LPEIEKLSEADRGYFGDSQDYNTFRDRLAHLYNSAAASIDLKGPKEAEDWATWDRIENAAGTKSYSQLVDEHDERDRLVLAPVSTL
jgi:hypothetical protein